MSNTIYVGRQRVESDATGSHPLDGPQQTGWRECSLTRAKEIETLCDGVVQRPGRQDTQVFARAIAVHLDAARQAAKAAQYSWWKPWRRRDRYRHAALRERAMSNLDAAEADLIKIASAEYVLGQFPSLLENVQCHLVADDVRRVEFERIAKRLGVNSADGPAVAIGGGDAAGVSQEQLAVVEAERDRIAAITRAASSAALREQVRVRSFRDVVVAMTVAMTFLAIAVGLVGFLSPALMPLCFAPEAEGQAVVVCPTEHSSAFSTDRTTDATAVDIDVQTARTANRLDLAVVEGVGLIAATLAAALSIRKLRGSSERYHLPLAMTLLKLPTGAITAFVGLMLMRGQFVPGLSALDTSAQILAWALLFGYSQQLFTQYVDRQGQTVMESVRGADMPRSTPDPHPSAPER